MTEAVVDVLEPIQVERHDGSADPSPAGALERMTETVQKQGAIGQTGERIM